MNVLNPVQIGLSGVSRGLENIQEISADIARTGTSENEGADASTDLTQSLVDLKQQELATQASIKVVDSGQEILGTLLDVTA